MDGSKASLAGIQVEFFCRLKRKGTPFIDSLVLSFFEKLQNGDVSKNCVVRYTSDSFESYIF
jgi:hypothetical protein